MTVTPPATFRIHPIPAGELDDVRADGTDASGNRAEHLTAGGGEPLRCCLRDAPPGDELLLFAYRLPLPDGPYRETGPVFVHAEPCAGPAGTTVYPPDWRGRPQVLRAYDERGRIHDATTTHDGRDPEKAITELLAQPGVVCVHSRNVAWGCYMFAVTRPE
ncbi:DUF1203 domain-containing protein [Streptomyces somaliensis]|uniref:DUF1203 domain-containing protein n=1 Tax=Streptomyces somaliensis TaxID=78355 RepID=UPI0020CBCBAB|nr:DUF1203 domain-containing protein [Streptomyces somaliensis]MCP9945089.1 DUF1203 domain-containing protein [Streptomyces somaliensis]MCP9961695.1 DUF1203 domain-containing protein [Streptomyces somaliensis]MCP9974511.1 DUF1203 domain-containing protein [Streptomyces somaliensis]